MIRSMLASPLLLALMAPFPVAAAGLFDADDTLELTLPVNFEALCRPSETPDCDYWPTVFRITLASGEQREVPVSIRRRDGWRAMHTNCQVPTLFVRFDTAAAAGTPFEGESELALTSHCGKGIARDSGKSPELPSDFERYVINEYLGYRMYNLVTEASLRVRLARIRYLDPEDPRRSITRDAFFAEHFRSLAARLDATALPPGSFEPDRLDQQAAVELALFQFMIGNTDWSIERQENILLLRFADGRDVPVLFDLDMSGLVNAHYAAPASGLPISHVRERMFLGTCHDHANWDAVFGKFRELNAAIQGVVMETPGLGRGDRRATGVYLDEFFGILDDSTAREHQIVSACRNRPEGAEMLSSSR